MRIANQACYRHLWLESSAARRAAGKAARGVERRQRRRRYAENLEQVGIPGQRPQVEQLWAGGGRRVAGVHSAAGQVPENPAVDRSHAQVAVRCASMSIRGLVEEPASLAGGKERIDRQTGVSPEAR